MTKKNKLYTVNRWNRPAFEQEANLFDYGGYGQGAFFQHQGGGIYGNAQNSYTAPVVTTPISGSLTRKSNIFNTPALTPPNIQNTYNFSNPLGMTAFKTDVNQTAKNAQNNYQQMANSFGTNQEPQLTDINAGTSKDPNLMGMAANLGATALSSKGKLSGLFGKGGAGWGIAGAAAGVLGSISTGERRGMWDTLDPMHHLASGRESGAGNVMGDAGVALTQAGLSSGQPYLALAGAGLKVLGELTNASFGIKTDQEKLKRVNEGIADYNTFNGATSLDDIKDVAAHTNANDVYEDGWFTNKGSKMQADLERRFKEARAFAYNNQRNNINNLINDQINMELANYSAFGGPLDNNGVGAIEYGFMSDLLNTKRKNAENKNQMTNMFAGTPNSMFAFGGNLQAHGSDFSTGLTHIDAGGTHSENPNDGVQLGVDSEGTPNLVEEGETVYNDYVYSNRILADEATKKLFHLPKKKDITFADISKKLEKEIAERPNDPISEAGFKAQMQTLEEQQERQKKEMEAQRAKEAFDALSPEEQTAIMQQAAQQETMAQQAAQEQAMAEQAAMQQPSPEEVAMMQQQADDTEANVGMAPEMAEGGHLFPKGGYLWDQFWSPVNEYSKLKGVPDNKYKVDKTYKGDIKELENSDAYKAFTDYILNNATDEERLKYFKWIDDNTGRTNKYLDKDGKLINGWQEAYKAARNDGLYGIQHYTPTWQDAIEEAVAKDNAVKQAAAERRIFHALEGDDDYIQGELDPNVVGPEIRKVSLPNGDTVIYHDKPNPQAAAVESATVVDTVAPRHKAEWPRYAGLFGPAVGLGLMSLGVGKPDTASLDAAVTRIGNPALAKYKPIGNYLSYRPMDIWYEQNRMDANSRATDRTILNSASPSRMAGLLANSYNNQIVDGNLYRQALEYNDAKRERVAEFNRGTDKYNADAYNQNQQFNASALNQNRNTQAHLALQAAAQKMAANNGWYNSLYGNLGQIFKGISDLGRENAQWNMVSDLAADSVFGNLGDSYTGRRYTKKVSKGGKVRRKRGLTY